MLNFMLHSLQPAHGGVNFILAQLYVGVYKFQEQSIFFVSTGIHTTLSTGLLPSQIVVSECECPSVPQTKEQALLGRIAFIVRKVQRQIGAVWKDFLQCLLGCLPETEYAIVTQMRLNPKRTELRNDRICLSFSVLTLLLLNLFSLVQPLG